MSYQVFSSLAKTQHAFERVILIIISQDLTMLAILEQNPPPLLLFCILTGCKTESKDIQERHYSMTKLGEM